MYSPSTAEHQRLVGFLYSLLRLFCEAKGCGEVLTGPAAVRLGPEVIREPDIFVVRPEDVSKARGVPLDLVPVFVIEVTSPSTRGIDLGEKVGDYAVAGIPEYWVVYAERKEIWVHVLQGSSFRAEKKASGEVRCCAVPGFTIRADWLWKRPLPAISSVPPKVLG